METSEHVKCLYAQQSLAYNIQNPLFCELFPQYVELHTQRVKERQVEEEANKKKQARSSSSSSSIGFTTAIGSGGLHRGRNHNHNHNANAFHGIVTTLAGLVAGVSILVAMRFM